MRGLDSLIARKGTLLSAVSRLIDEALLSVLVELLFFVPQAARGPVVIEGVIIPFIYDRGSANVPRTVLTSELAKTLIIDVECRPGNEIHGRHYPWKRSDRTCLWAGASIFRTEPVAVELTQAVGVVIRAIPRNTTLHPNWRGFAGMSISSAN